MYKHSERRMLHHNQQPNKFLGTVRACRAWVQSTRSKTVCMEALNQPAREDIGAHRQYLFHSALGRLRNREQAEDAVQETFLAALASDGTFSSTSTKRRMVSGEMRSIFLPNFLLNLERKNITKSGTSPARSRSGGSLRGKTLSR